VTRRNVVRILGWISLDRLCAAYITAASHITTITVISRVDAHRGLLTE